VPVLQFNDGIAKNAKILIISRGLDHGLEFLVLLEISVLLTSLLMGVMLLLLFWCIRRPQTSRQDQELETIIEATIRDLDNAVIKLTHRYYVAIYDIIIYLIACC